MSAAAAPIKYASGPALATFLGVAGLTHFLRPTFYDPIVPRILPGGARTWTLTSGVAELACAAAIARPSTRRTGATVAAALFVAVFPANVQMALDWRGRSRREKALAYLRLPLQIPLFTWALRVRSAS